MINLRELANGVLIWNFDELDYFIERLEKSIEKQCFYVSELCSIEYKKSNYDVYGKYIETTM